MGRRAYHGVVPYKITNVQFKGFDKIENKISSTDYEDGEAIGNDWLIKITEQDFVEGIYIQSYLCKNEFKVYFLNESPYSNVGRCELAILAKDEKSLEVFMNDFNFSQTIEKNQSVVWYV